MKYRIVAIILALAMVVMLTGCDFISKPEDVVNELITQESMMDLLSVVEETLTEDADGFWIKFWLGVLTSSSVKALLLDSQVVRKPSFHPS